jgi:hypothetical protein
MNFDGVLDIVDYQQNVNFLLQNEYTPDTTELNEYNVLYDAADVNGDGAIDVLDAAALHIDITFGEPTQANNYLGEALPTGYFQTGLAGTGFVYDTRYDSHKSDSVTSVSVSTDTSNAPEDPLGKIFVRLKTSSTSSNLYILYRTSENFYETLGGVPELDDEGFYTSSTNSSNTLVMELIEEADKVYAVFHFPKNSLPYAIDIFNKTFIIPSNAQTSQSTYKCDITNVIPYRELSATIYFVDGTSKDVKFHATTLDGRTYKYWLLETTNPSLVVKNGGTYTSELDDFCISFNINSSALTNSNSNRFWLIPTKNVNTVSLTYGTSANSSNINSPFVKFSETIKSIEIMDSLYEFPRYYVYDLLNSEATSGSNFIVQAKRLSELYVRNVDGVTKKFPKMGSSSIFVENGKETDLEFCDNAYKHISTSSNRASIISTTPLDFETIKGFVNLENQRIVTQFNEDYSYTQLRFHYNFPEIPNPTYSSTNFYSLTYEHTFIKTPSIPTTSTTSDNVIRISTPARLWGETNYSNEIEHPAGYEFIGWSTTRNEENIVLPRVAFDGYSSYISIYEKDFINMVKFSQDETIDLYAIWKPTVTEIWYAVPDDTVSTNSTYYIDYDDGYIIKNASTKQTVSIDWYYNTPKSSGLYNASTFGLKKAGYKFVGWRYLYSTIDTPCDEDTIFDQNDKTFTPEKLTMAAQYESSIVILEPVWEPTQ